MQRRNRGYEVSAAIRRSLVVDERIVSVELVASSSLAGTPDHLERRHTMHRISLTSRTLVVFAVMAATALLAAAFPLIAMAADGGPTGS
jgi:hypothetical protein